MLKKKNKLAYVFFLVFSAAFIFITLKGLATAQPGDENVYYYMGKLITEGKVPYRDFFFAHPPLHIYLIASIYKIFGFNILILKLIPLISTLISVFFIFKIAKEKFGNAEAVISSLLFLFSYSVMFDSVFSFGIEVATMFLVIGAYLLWSRNYDTLAGISFGLAGATRLLSLLPIFVIFVLVFLSSKKKFLKLSFVFLIIFLLINGIFILLFGADYLVSVYKYHLLKSLGGKENFREYIDIIKLNWILFSSFLLFIFVKEKKPIAMPVIISIAYLVFLTALKKLFGFYFIVIFPFLALTGGYSIVNIAKKFSVTCEASSSRLARHLPKIFLQKIFLIILLLIFAWNLLSDVLFLEKIGFKGFERGNDLIDFVNANSNKGTLLFGDDSVVPLLALLTDKKIALDFVDTNNEVFISGVKNLSNVLSNLKGKDVLFIIRSSQGISYFSDVKEFLNKDCEFLGSFHDKIEGSYLIYKCK